MNKESKKLTWAVGLVAGLGVLSIAYAALSSTLNIDGKNASVNVGYVHFEDSSAPYGIGSTNTEYLNGTESGGIFPTRSDNTKGLILAGENNANFKTGWAQSLGEHGTFTITSESKAKDKIVIDGAKLNDYGSFLVYKLDIINDSANDMKLTSIPDITVNATETEGSAKVSNIEAEIYSNCVTENFKEPCTATVEAYAGSEKTNAPNYLTPNGKTTWYLKVGFKNYSEAENNVSGSTPFTFSVVPKWEAAIDAKP